MNPNGLGMDPSMYYQGMAGMDRMPGGLSASQVRWFPLLITLRGMLIASRALLMLMTPPWVACWKMPCLKTSTTAR